MATESPLLSGQATSKPVFTRCFGSGDDRDGGGGVEEQRCVCFTSSSSAHSRLGPLSPLHGSPCLLRDNPQSRPWPIGPSPVGDLWASVSSSAKWVNAPFLPHGWGYNEIRAVKEAGSSPLPR